MDRLFEMQTFIAIVESGSLAGAARRLGRSPPAVTRLLSTLEARVGQTLIERTTRRCTPTEAGERFAEHARLVLSNYDEAIAEAVGEVTHAKGLIRVTAPLVFGREYVAPLINRFLDAQPTISIDLQLSDGIVDLHDTGVDLAVRVGRLSDPTLIARKIGELRRIVVASPDYISSNGEPRHPNDLIEHDVIQHMARGVIQPWTFRDGHSELTVDLTGRLAINQADAAVAAARDRRGLVRILSYQAVNDLAAGRLVRVLRDHEPEPLPVHLVWPQSRRSWRRIRLIVDHLAVGLERLEVLRSEASASRAA